LVMETVARFIQSSAANADAAAAVHTATPTRARKKRFTRRLCARAPYASLPTAYNLISYVTILFALTPRAASPFPVRQLSQESYPASPVPTPPHGELQISRIIGRQPSLPMAFLHPAQNIFSCEPKLHLIRFFAHPLRRRQCPSHNLRASLNVDGTGGKPHPHRQSTQHHGQDCGSRHSQSSILCSNHSASSANGPFG
jgi:hypothetical protein